MPYELRDGQGSLFREKEKKSEKAPDYRGSVKIDGTVYELAGWIKEGGKGSFLSLAAKVKEAPQAKREGRNSNFDSSDPIPF